jgi:hypothetical protein
MASLEASSLFLAAPMAAVAPQSAATAASALAAPPIDLAKPTDATFVAIASAMAGAAVVSGAEIAAPVLAGVGVASTAGIGALLAVPLLVVGQRAFHKVCGGTPSGTQSSTDGVAPHVAPRAGVVQMYNISKHDGIWGFEAKKEVFDAWDPEKPRDYQNFNPFERNDEGQMCDANGCFPGQSKAYKPPIRPDVTYALQQEISKKQAELMASPKGSMTGKPGNFTRDWDKNLAAPTDSW